MQLILFVGGQKSEPGMKITWRWNKEVDRPIKEKTRLLTEWMKGTAYLRSYANGKERGLQS